MSSAVLIQQASEDYVPMLDLVAGRHGAYCAKHGITYWPVFGPVQFSRAAQWNKIVLIQRALDMGFETVAWLDADTLIMRDDEDIRTALNGGGALGLALHPTPGLDAARTHWNTGVMVVRNTPRTRGFFDAVWQAGPLGDHHWHEQARMLAMLPDYPELVQRIDDRWNASEDVTPVPNPCVKAWHGFGLSTTNQIYRELKRLGAVDGRVTTAAEAFVHEDNAVERTDRFIETIPPFPNTFSGRGIVTCGGGVGYFTTAWVCIHQLRRIGCTLPIQLWYLGPREVNEHMRALLAPLGVECIDAHEVRKKHPAKILNGWELKPYAMLHCPFREVLLLDSDNVAIVNPEFLFATPQFHENGAVFWPDHNHMEPGRSAWQVFRVPFRDEPEFESGQILVDKEKCWPALQLAMWFNENSDCFYHHVYGDKDTFRFAWHRIGQKFSMPPYPLRDLEDAMCQHDFQGRVIFQHRNMDKWNFFRENKHVAGFLFEDECRADVARLRSLWNGRVNPNALTEVV
jgi:hypothetical protein